MKSEKKTADAILQNPKEVVVGEVTYIVAPPSAATIILVSELVSQLPQVKVDKEDVISETLRIAKNCKVLGDISATLILGAKFFSYKPSTEASFRHFISGKSNKSVIYDPLVKSLMEDLTPKQLYELTIDLLGGMDTAFFFALTTSLIEVNLIKPTRVAVS